MRPAHLESTHHDKIGDHIAVVFDAHACFNFDFMACRPQHTTTPTVDGTPVKQTNPKCMAMY